MYTSGKCWCCRQQRPVDGHHIAPLEYGGDRNGKQVKLCKSCHSLAHYEAEYYFTHGKYAEIDNTVPESTSMGARLRKLTNKIIKTKLEFEEGLRSVDHEQRRMSQISWDSQQELDMAHDVKRALNFTSLERAIKLCVFEMHKALQQRGKI